MARDDYDDYDEYEDEPRRRRRRPDIPNYLVQSILVTLFCCWPLGIPAIIFAAQVNSRLGEGDVRGARDASGKAKLFCWLALGLGLAAACISAVAWGIIIASNPRAFR